jgi:hypothetical protein
LPLLDFEDLVNKCERIGDIDALKSIVLTYIFSLKKENRNLHRRLNDRADNIHTDNTGMPSMLDYRRPLEMDENFSEFKQMVHKVDQKFQDFTQTFGYHDDNYHFEQLKKEVNTQLNLTSKKNHFATDFASPSGKVEKLPMSEYKLGIKSEMNNYRPPALTSSSVYSKQSLKNYTNNHPIYEVT